MRIWLVTYDKPNPHNPPNPRNCEDLAVCEDLACNRVSSNRTCLTGDHFFRTFVEAINWQADDFGGNFDYFS